MKKIFSSAFKQASKGLAKEMSEQLTNSALTAGWPSDVAQGLKVEQSNGVFSMSHEEGHGGQVFDLEHGTESNRGGSGTLREMRNNDKAHTARFAVLYEKALIKQK